MRSRCHQRGYGFGLEDELWTLEYADMSDRMRKIISMELLLASLVMFIAFHFVIIDFSSKCRAIRGWAVWRDAFRSIRNPIELHLLDIHGIPTNSFLLNSLLIVSSPFLWKVWPRSLYVWCLATSFSGLGSIAYSWCYRGKFMSNPEFWLLIAAPYLNFLGLLLARRWREEPRNPFSETNPTRQYSLR